MFRRRAKKKVGPVGTGIWRHQLPSILDDAAHQDDAGLAAAEATTPPQRRQHRRQKSQQNRGKSRRPSQELQDEALDDLVAKFSRGETQSTAGTASSASSDGGSSDPSPAAPRGCTGFRSDYKLGDVVRDASHMLVTPAPGEALKNHDHAFLKRSDGSRTYAILAFRTDQRMIFVTDGTGKRKEVGRRRWAEFVALVAPEEKNRADAAEEADEESSPATDDASIGSDNLSHETRRQSLEEDDDLPCKDAYKRRLLKKEWIPPEVAFVHPDDDDECSSLSEASMRKRRTPEEEELEMEAKKFVSDCIGGKTKHGNGGGGGGGGGYLPWERYTTPEYILRNPRFR